jgi:hypothetical protein
MISGMPLLNQWALTLAKSWTVISVSFSNKELTQKEFDVSMKIKIAMNCLMEENLLGAKEYLTDALRTLHR